MFLHISQVQVLEMPFAGHSDWGLGPWGDRAMDFLDIARELAALLYNAPALLTASWKCVVRACRAMDFFDIAREPAAMLYNAPALLTAS